MKYVFPRCSALTGAAPSASAKSEKLQVSDPKGICFAVRILAKVCNPDSVVGNFANSEQNGRTVSN
jgi:hypothetical protein